MLKGRSTAERARNVLEKQEKTFQFVNFFVDSNYTLPKCLSLNFLNQFMSRIRSPLHYRCLFQQKEKLECLKYTEVNGIARDSKKQEFQQEFHLIKNHVLIFVPRSSGSPHSDLTASHLNY